MLFDFSWLRRLFNHYSGINPSQYFFNDLGLIFYFTEPGSVFFTNPISFHDEVCFFPVWILVFTHWMLYSILTDHIYHIDFVNSNKPNLFTNILIFCRYRIITAAYASLLNHTSSSDLWDSDSPKSFWITNLFSNYVKNIILSSLGYSSSKDLKSLSDFSFFEEKGIENLILNKYDIYSKSLFTGSISIYYHYKVNY